MLPRLYGCRTPFVAIPPEVKSIKRPWHHHRLLEEMVQPYPADNTYMPDVIF
jgi:hypothetical protein